jgi:exo-beta-1,3-glucanase (GH17 family)
LIATACASAQPPASTGPVVKINSPQGEEPLEIVPSGQRIAFWAEAGGEEVFYRWELTGGGDLTDTSSPRIQYVAPQSVDSNEEVLLSVTVTDKATGRIASDYFVIRLLPTAPAANSVSPSVAGVTSLPPTALPTSAPSPSAPDEVTITITNPPSGGKANCPVPAPELCLFQVRGSVTGVPGNALVRVWVQPVNPSGDPPGAWYLQANPAQISADGSWEATLQIGNFQYPAHTGDTLKFVAWLVTPGESDKLDARLGFPTLIPENVATYLAQTTEVELMADRTLDSLNKKLPTLCWVAYAPTNFDPNQDIFPPEESIRSDLQLLREAGFAGLVTYGADQAIHQVAQEIGFQGLILGVWDPTNSEEIAYAEEAAQYDVVTGYVIGNEGLYVRYDYETLQAAIEGMRQATGKPVTTTEQFEDYSEARLLELGDWVFPNTHPYWHRITDPEAAAKWTAEHFAELATKTTRPVIFKEVGLPSGGDAMVSEAGQAMYYRLLQKTPAVFAYFEAFDQPWKDWAPVEPYWGLFHSDRSPKEVARYVCGN